eukprot:gnl/TRDRNA2_/TRDRNA2_179060_c0_seq1.p1 gnl/TRDRNA2_/TRDRNA2_179060_c0~~gnl/TRDRNA2_/TRDRNA2_179060_c0_seq1.p1  ORF type:complete len:509 (-),score=82.64 gnl/TRDRNA2_/TRDRNA2_179060_c0_seq1:198-1724(-)
MSDGPVTVGQCVEGLPLGRCVWEVLICAWLAWFILGAINESTLLSFGFFSTEWEPNQQNMLLFAGALTAGNMIAALLGGWLADEYGRLSVARPAVLATILVSVMLHMSQTLVQALIARFLLGLASGSLIAVMPPLVAELLPSRHRGFFLTIWCSGWPCGALFAVMIGCMLPGVPWKAFYTVLIVPAIVLYVFLRVDMLLESPRYLYLAGRRDHGYLTLMDMYEKQQFPLPWSPESIAVASAPARSGKGSKDQPTLSATLIWLVIAFFFVSAGAMSMKLWMPTMLIAQEADGAHDGGLHLMSMYTFAEGPQALSFLSLAHAPMMMKKPTRQLVLLLTQGYILEFAGIVLFAYVATWVRRKPMVQVSIISACIFTIGTLVAAASNRSVLCGPLLGCLFALQSTSFNFLQVFACEYFPTSRRAKAIALLIFASQLGSIVIPVASGLVVKLGSPTLAVVVFSFMFFVAWAASRFLPLSNGKEQSLHDVDEPKDTAEAAAQSRKSQWLGYQTI